MPCERSEETGSINKRKLLGYSHELKLPSTFHSRILDAPIISSLTLNHSRVYHPAVGL